MEKKELMNYTAKREDGYVKEENLITKGHIFLWFYLHETQETGLRGNEVNEWQCEEEDGVGFNASFLQGEVETLKIQCGENCPAAV